MKADDNGGGSFRHGIGGGKQYRLKPALAAALYVLIAGFWILFTDKILDAMVEPSLLTGAQIIKGLFFVAITGVIFYVVYARAYAAKIQALNTLEASLHAHETLLSTISDYAMIILDSGGFVKSWNEGAARIKGYKDREILGSHFSVFYPESDTSSGLPKKNLERAANEGRCEYEGWRIRRDGSRFWGSVVLSAIYGQNGEVTGFIKITRDLTERRNMEAALASKVRALTALGEFNQALMRIRDETQIYKEICRICVEKGGYKMAWVGIAENDSAKSVSIAAYAGHEDGYLDFAGISWEDSERGRGPTGTAIRTGKPYIANDIASDQRFKPWRENAIARGYASSVALPLQVEGKTIGALNLYADEAEAFDAEEIQLLVELAGDLSFGIETIKAHKLHQLTDAALAETEKKYQELFEHSPIGIYRTTPDGRILMANPAILKMLNYSSFAELEKENLEDWGHYHGYPRAEFKEIMESTGEVLGLESAWVTKNGKLVYVRENARCVRDNIGNIVFYDGIVEDITEIRLAAREIETHRHLLKTVLDASPNMISVRDKNGLIRLANSAYAAFYGTTPEDLIGKSVVTLWEMQSDTPTNIAAVLREDREIIETGNITDEIEKVLDRFGNTVFFRCTKKRVSLADGSVGVFITLQNVTELKLAHEAIKESEGKFRAVIKASKDGMIVVDMRGEIKLFNPAAEKMFGRLEADMIGASLDVLMSKEAHGKHSTAFGKANNSPGSIGTTTEPILSTAISSDGRTFPVEITLSEGFFGNERIILAVIRDVTEARLAEEALRASEERYRRFFEEDLTGDFIATIDGKILDCNRAFAEIFGFESVRDALSGEFKSIFPTTQVLMKFISDVKEYGKLHNHEMTLKRLDGRNVFTLMNALGEFDEYGSLMAIRGYIFDMTQQKIIEEQLRHAQKLEAIGRLAGGIAHDFNNLLTGIIGYSDMVYEAVMDNEDLKADVAEIKSAANRAADLVSKLMIFSRQQEMEPVDLNLNDLIGGMVKLLKRVIGENIDLELITGYSLGTIHADRTQIEQVIMNLSVNARDAMPNGGTLTLETENVVVNGGYIAAHPWALPGRYVLLTVTDSGIGMTGEVMEHMFEPFFTTKGVGEGTGLGMATVYGIVKKHGGLIHVYSESPMGSTIKVYFPLKERPASDVGTKIAGPVKGGTERILLAEDEGVVQDLVTRVLKKAGYKVQAVWNGEDAVAEFEKAPDAFGLVILDIVMPKMGGVDAFKAIKEINPEQKILFSSGYSTDSLRAKEALKYCDDMINKPYNPDELLRMVRRILDRAPEK